MDWSRAYIVELFVAWLVGWLAFGVKMYFRLSTRMLPHEANQDVELPWLGTCIPTIYTILHNVLAIFKNIVGGLILLRCTVYT